MQIWRVKELFVPGIVASTINWPFVSPTYINPQRPHSMPYTKLVDLQERLSKLCVVKERFVKLLEKELSVMRILRVLQFLLPH